MKKQRSKAGQFNKLKLKKIIKSDRNYLKGYEDANQFIARELHDNICTRLILLKYAYAQVVPKELLSEIEAICEELRQLSHTLLTPDFRIINLYQGLYSLLYEFSSLNHFSLNYFIDEKIQNISIEQEYKVSIYRILQEGMINILKHAAATIVNISVYAESNTIQIILEDNGKGFDFNLQTTGFGLKLMHERADCCGGEIQIYSLPEKGTLIHVSLPF